ncbi:MAG: hypothetical protein R3B06_11865 [Kofleriaceae bacterium]
MKTCAWFVLAVALVVSGCSDNSPAITDAGIDSGGADGSVDGPDVDAGPACAGLDQATCAATAGCAVDLCAGCLCDALYNGCRDAATLPAECPVLGCPISTTCCRSTADCGGLQCATPDDPPGCGICQDVPSTCTTDLDCQVATSAGIGGVPICEPVACACNPASACVPGCVDDSTCGEAEACDVPSGRCRPQTCDAATPCPLDFDCAAGACVRRTCTDDTACDNFCVEGACRGALGMCTMPPA